MNRTKTIISLSKRLKQKITIMLSLLFDLKNRFKFQFYKRDKSKLKFQNLKKKENKQNKTTFSQESKDLFQISEDLLQEKIDNVTLLFVEKKSVSKKQIASTNSKNSKSINYNCFENKNFRKTELKKKNNIFFQPFSIIYTLI